MAATVVLYMWSGVTGAKVKLFALDSDTVANNPGADPSGDALTESTNRKGRYTATVAEVLSGEHRAIVFDSAGDPMDVAFGVRMIDGQVCECYGLTGDQVVRDLLEGDHYIDTEQDPWELVIIKKDSGNLSNGIRLLVQQIKQVDGTDVSSTNHIPGQRVAA